MQFIHKTGALLVLVLLITGCGAHCKNMKPGSQIMDDEVLNALTQVAQEKIKAAKAGDYRPLADDFDGDGLTNERESKLGTNPYDPDTDGDRYRSN